MESARADFNLRELPCYLSNTYKILPLLQKFIYWRTRFGKKKIVKGITCCHDNPIFDDIFGQNFTFLTFFLLINDFFKTIANYLSQSQEINIFF